MKHLKIWVLFALFVALSIAIFFIFRKRYERYGTALGSLAPYNERLGECLRLCEKDDISSRFGMRFNPICIRRCYRNFDTELLLNEQEITTIPITSGKSNQYFAPRAQYQKSSRQGCLGEVVDKCIQRCNHTCGDMLSTYCKCNKGKYGECVNLCVDTLKNNCNSVDWSWRYD
ncbi:MAG TPA: hypothetical protein VLE02_01640 [Nitrosarchaeum sp.]|nr:hypothetical protein [Nitrosarchaeum sp.]